MNELEFLSWEAPKQTSCVPEWGLSLRGVGTWEGCSIPQLWGGSLQLRGGISVLFLHCHLWWLNCVEMLWDSCAVHFTGIPTQLSRPNIIQELKHLGLQGFTAEATGWVCKDGRLPSASQTGERFINCMACAPRLEVVIVWANSRWCVQLSRWESAGAGCSIWVSRVRYPSGSLKVKCQLHHLHGWTMRSGPAINVETLVSQRWACPSSFPAPHDLVPLPQGFLAGGCPLLWLQHHHRLRQNSLAGPPFCVLGVGMLSGYRLHVEEFCFGMSVSIQGFKK